MKNLFHSICLLCFVSFTQAQGDSIRGNPFKLNKFKIGLEVGNSPRYLPYYYYYDPVHQSKRPFLKGCIGYNLLLKNNWYFTPALGIAYEEFYNETNRMQTTEFSFIDTVAGNTVIYNGRKHLANTNTYFEKRYSAIVDLDLQKVYSPFKNEKFKLTHSTGFSVKPNIWNNTVSTFSYYRDSCSITNIFVVERSDYRSEQTSKLKFQGPVDLQLNLNLGIINDGFRIQQQVGLKFQVQWGIYSGRYVEYTSRFMRIYYSINI